VNIVKIEKKLFLFVLLIIGGFSVNAFPSMKEVSEVIREANNQKLYDNRGMVRLYKQCNSIIESKDLYLLMNIALMSESCRMMNLIAFSRKKLKFGRIDDAFNQISPQINTILKQNDIVLADYYAFLGELALLSENPLLSIYNYKQALFYSQKTKSKYLIQKKTH